MDETLAHKPLVDELKKRVEHFAQIDHVKKLREHWIPHFDKFGMMIQNFVNDINQMRECVK